MGVVKWYDRLEFTWWCISKTAWSSLPLVIWEALSSPLTWYRGRSFRTPWLIDQATPCSNLRVGLFASSRRCCRSEPPSFLFVLILRCWSRSLQPSSRLSLQTLRNPQNRVPSWSSQGHLHGRNIAGTWLWLIDSLGILLWLLKKMENWVYLTQLRSKKNILLPL